MSTEAATATVRSSIVVEAPIDRAFRVFTEDFGRFKPREHNMLGVAIAETVFEPPGGRPHLRPRRRRQRVPLGPGAGVRAAPSGRVQLGHQPAVGRSRPT
jgi:hypothetical protein